MASISANSSISIDGFAVGSDRLIGGRGWIGQIAEVVVFNSKLSDDDRYKVEGYSQKMGPSSFASNESHLQEQSPRSRHLGWQCECWNPSANWIDI